MVLKERYRKTPPPTHIKGRFSCLVNQVPNGLGFLHWEDCVAMGSAENLVQPRSGHAQDSLWGNRCQFCFSIEVSTSMLDEGRKSVEPPRRHPQRAFGCFRGMRRSGSSTSAAWRGMSWRPSSLTGCCPCATCGPTKSAASRRGIQRAGFRCGLWSTCGKLGFRTNFCDKASQKKSSLPKPACELP